MSSLRQGGSGATSGHPAALLGCKSGRAIWLLRHGEVAEEWRGIAYGDLDVKLSPEGQERTSAMGTAFAALPPARVLSSHLVRARALGEATARGADLTLEIVPALAEIHRGTWQGKTVNELNTKHPDEIEAFYADPWGWCGHAGETDADVLERLRPVVAEVLSATPNGDGGPVVFATHYNVIRILTAAAMGIPPARSFSLRVDTGRAVKLVDGTGGFELHNANVLAPGEPVPCAIIEDTCSPPGQAE